MTKEQVEARLKERFPDGTVEVIDLTGTQDHYQVSILSKAFEGLTRIKQHRLVMDVFPQELASGELHAFAIKTSASKEKEETTNV